MRMQIIDTMIKWDDEAETSIKKIVSFWVYTHTMAVNAAGVHKFTEQLHSSS